jgi:transposase
MSKAKDAAHYWTQTLHAEFAGRVYRFIVVRSSKLDSRKKKKLERVLETEQKDLAQLKKQLEKESFQCEPDAKARLDAVLAENKTLHRLTGRVVRQQTIKRPPGRPRKDRQEAILETIQIH